MHTLFVLIYDLLDISLKSLTLLTATFFEWNLKKRLARVYLTTINVYEYIYIFFSDQSKFELSPY